MAAADLEVMPCRECGAESRGAQPKHCWLCGAGLESPANDVLLRPASAQQQAGNTFGLATLMVVVALCAVLFGVFRESPGLGILLAFVGTAALFATFGIAEVRVSTGRPMTIWGKLGTFLAAAGSMAGISLIVAGFVVVAWVSAINSLIPCGGASCGKPGVEVLTADARTRMAVGLLLLAGVAGVAGVYVFYRFVRWLWQIRDKP